MKDNNKVQTKAKREKGQLRKAIGFMYGNMIRVDRWVGLKSIKEGGSFISNLVKGIKSNFYNNQAPKDARKFDDVSPQELEKYKQGYLTNIVIMSVFFLLVIFYIVYMFISGAIFVPLLLILVTAILGCFIYKLYKFVDEITSYQQKNTKKIGNNNTEEN